MAIKQGHADEIRKFVHAKNGKEKNVAANYVDAS